MTYHLTRRTVLVFVSFVNSVMMLCMGPFGIFVSPPWQYHWYSTALVGSHPNVCWLTVIVMQYNTGLQWLVRQIKVISSRCPCIGSLIWYDVYMPSAWHGSALYHRTRYRGNPFSKYTACILA